MLWNDILIREAKIRISNIYYKSLLGKVIPEENRASHISFSHLVYQHTQSLLFRPDAGITSRSMSNFWIETHLLLNINTRSLTVKCSLERSLLSSTASFLCILTRVTGVENGCMYNSYTKFNSKKLKLLTFIFLNFIVESITYVTADILKG